MYAPVVKYAILPLIEIKRGYSTPSLIHLRKLEKSQWRSREQLEDLQNKRLRALIRHAYENVPYYHKIFRQKKLKPDDIKTTYDLLKLPILTKQEIKKNLSDLIAKNYPPKRLTPSSTGGSTGEPLKFYKDKHTGTIGIATLFRTWRWAGWEIGDKYVDLWGSWHDTAQYTKMWTKINNIFLQNHLMLDAANLSEQSMTKYLQQIRKFQPKIVRGYAQALSLLARFMKHKGINDIKVNSIITAGEQLFDYQRKPLEDAFGGDVFDSYGCRESAVIAAECPEHMGYHISVETGLYEFVKADEHVSSGELGKILITDFNNYAMPFIRYEVGDAGRPTHDMCSCGRGLPLMQSIEGRITDFIITPDGKYILGTGLSQLFWKYESVKQAIIVQEAKDKLIIKLVRESNYTQKDTTHIEREMRRFVGDDMKIEFEFVKTIPLGVSGKRRSAISKVPVEL
jgi:phenylacetate-CoA ligase